MRMTFKIAQKRLRIAFHKERKSLRKIGYCDSDDDTTAILKSRKERFKARHFS
jgi:hypothetical protein